MGCALSKCTTFSGGCWPAEPMPLEHRLGQFDVCQGGLFCEDQHRPSQPHLGGDRQQRQSHPMGHGSGGLLPGALPNRTRPRGSCILARCSLRGETRAMCAEHGAHTCVLVGCSSRDSYCETPEKVPSRDSTALLDFGHENGICQVMLSMACSYRVEGIVIRTLSIAHRMARGPRQKGVRASDRRVLELDTLRDSSTFASGQHRLRAVKRRSTNARLFSSGRAMKID